MSAPRSACAIIPSVVPGTGNTTVPTPEDPSSSSPASRVVPALFLAWSAHQPDRAGEVALFDPDAADPFVLGREDAGDPARVHFLQLRPGETVDGGPLTGRNISRQQLRITVEGDAVRVRNVGTARVVADGAEVPRDSTVLLRPGAVLEVPGNSVLLVGRSPLSLPPPPARLLPLHPFGEVDRLGFVGESCRAQQLREDVAFAASAGRHVFVHGPTGTGKELVAHAIHKLSARSGGPYVTANSASFTAELAALELFGNPRSYPNPGTPQRPGYFGQARGGTLLLDEIGEVLATVQAPLLRALDGAYNRVGDPAPRATECVVVVSTNRGAASVKHDVLHRLGVTVETPALADRREDVPLLVRALLLRMAGVDAAFEKAFVRPDARGWQHVEIDASLIVGLLRSPLPGNVREVANILTLAIAASGGQLPLRWPPRLTLPPPAPLAMQAEPADPGVDELVQGLRAAPDPGKALVRQALEDNRWHYERTASALGMSTDKLYRLRIKYGLHRPE
jgi:DNA-binding NtrC family response regulator